MQALVWWLVPVAAFVIAVIAVSIISRPRPRADPHDSVAEHERFGQAMRRQTSGPDHLDGPEAEGPASPSGHSSAPE